jgi:tetraprenyl-beta-curcumene synthase
VSPIRRGYGYALVQAARYVVRVRPLVGRALAPLVRRAGQIADERVRALALASLATKRFHCEGGAALVGPDPRAVRWVVAYQTLVDFLDSVTDRGPTVPARIIWALHEAALDAVAGHPSRPYFAGHPWDDGGYAAWLVANVHQAAHDLPGWPTVVVPAAVLARRYAELQTLKHQPDRTRRARSLASWVRARQASGEDLAWWEWAAAAGSTLGLFALVRETLGGPVAPARTRDLLACYWPWMGALHILLDYFVDQEEDRRGGDFNFVACYPSADAAVIGIERVLDRVLTQCAKLADGPWHRWVATGLVGFYLADRKVSGPLREPARLLIRHAGGESRLVRAVARLARSP